MAFKEDLQEVIEILASSISKETQNEHNEIYTRLKTLYEECPKDFLDLVESGTFKIGMLLEAVMDMPKQKNQHIAPYLANGLYEHFHKQRIQNLEGLSCSADKSSFIRSMTFKALRENTNLSLFADYQNVEQIKEDKERQAYWSPTSVKDTDEAMQLFWDWYLLRGNSN